MIGWDPMHKLNVFRKSPLSMTWTSRICTGHTCSDTVGNQLLAIQKSLNLDGFKIQDYTTLISRFIVFCGFL